ncbi:MAG: hypothetical protein ABSF21_05160 [Dehalococcoidia bacterium]
MFTRCSGAKVMVLDFVKYIVEGAALKPQDAQKFIVKLKESLINLKTTAHTCHSCQEAPKQEFTYSPK